MPAEIEEDPAFVRAACEDDMKRADAEIDRLNRGIRSIEEYLLASPPRVGDALFICEALQAR